MNELIEEFKNYCNGDPVLKMYLDGMKYYLGCGEWQLVNYARDAKYQENYINGAWRLFLEMKK